MKEAWGRVRLAGSGQEIARLRRAQTLWERFRGLMLSPLPRPGEALWLPACDSVHTAFVRGPLDLLFLRGERIVRVCPGVPPWRIVACLGADTVIEMAPGEVKRLGLAPQQRLELAREPAGTSG